MSRFDQRLRQDLQDPEFAAGYDEQGVALQLMSLLETHRKLAHISATELARRSGLSREVMSRLFHAEEPNPTLETLSRLLRALHLQAEVAVRPAPDGEQPPILIIEAVS